MSDIFKTYKGAALHRAVIDIMIAESINELVHNTIEAYLLKVYSEE